MLAVISCPFIAATKPVTVKFLTCFLTVTTFPATSIPYEELSSVLVALTPVAVIFPEFNSNPPFAKIPTDCFIEVPASATIVADSTVISPKHLIAKLL